MPSTHALQMKLANKTEELLNKDPDPEQRMRELEDRFKSNGLIESPEFLRTDSPAMFVQDLIEDNPLVLDWVALNRPRLLSVGQAQSIPDVLSRL